MKTQGLPPKMAEKLAAEAREGKADNYLGAGIAQFYRGNICITIMSYDKQGRVHGHQEKETTAQIAERKRTALSMEDRRRKDLKLS